MTSEAAIKNTSFSRVGHLTKVLLNGCLMAATSEATKEYMVNPISVGIRPIGMKLGVDVDMRLA